MAPLSIYCCTPNELEEAHSIFSASSSFVCAVYFAGGGGGGNKQRSLQV